MPHQILPYTYKVTKKEHNLEMGQKELVDGINGLIKTLNLKDNATISLSIQSPSDHCDNTLYLMVTLCSLEVTLMGITYLQTQMEIMHKGRRANYINYVKGLGGTPLATSSALSDSKNAMVGLMTTEEHTTPHTTPLCTIAVLASLEQEAIRLGLVLDRPDLRATSPDITAKRAEL